MEAGRDGGGLGRALNSEEHRVHRVCTECGTVGTASAVRSSLVSAQLILQKGTEEDIPLPWEKMTWKVWVKLASFWEGSTMQPLPIVVCKSTGEMAGTGIAGETNAVPLLTGWWWRRSASCGVVEAGSSTHSRVDENVFGRFGGLGPSDLSRRSL